MLYGGFGLLWTAGWFGLLGVFGWFAPWCPPEHWGCSDLVVALSCALLPLPLLRFVAGVGGPSDGRTCAG
jgi:hypothetical protein